MFKLRYSLVPACICFGPFFMIQPMLWSDISWLNRGFALLGAFMLTAGLRFICDAVFGQLVKQHQDAGKIASE